MSEPTTAGTTRPTSRPATGAARVAIADSSRPGTQIELEHEVIGSGPPLVWLHGLSGSLAESRLLAQGLSERFTVLTYSTRGHGWSDPVLERDRYTYEVIAHDLERMLETVAREHPAFEHPIIAGGSHGANTAMRHAALFPGRARGLVLVAPGANALRRPKRPQWWLVRGSLSLAARRGGDDGVIKAITGQDVNDPAHDTIAVEAARTHDFTSLKAAMRYIADQQVVTREQLAAISVPTVVGAWPKDPLIHPIAVAQEIAATIPGAVFHEMPRPHGLPAEEFARVGAELIGNWAVNL